MTKEEKKEYMRLWCIRNKKRVKEYNQRNKEHARRRSKEYYQKHKKQKREWKLKRKYNMTLEQYDKMLKEQKGCCAVCGVNQNELSRAFDIDHDHKTGDIRGLLCNKCNVALGTTKAENLNERQKIYLRGFKMTIERDYKVEIIETTVTKGILKVRAENEDVANALAQEIFDDGDIGSHEDYTSTTEVQEGSVDFIVR